jgi:hypothetical protein
MKLVTQDRDGLLRVAAEFIMRRHGADAVRLTREFAQRADHIDDLHAAKAWRDIAEAIEQLRS